MMVLGITGGVGAGKSTVLDYMKEKYQAVILQADLAAHDLMQKGADWRMIREEHSVRPTMNTEESRKTVRTTRRAATLPAGRKRRVRGRS